MHHTAHKDITRPLRDLIKSLGPYEVLKGLMMTQEPHEGFGMFYLRQFNCSVNAFI